MAQISDQPPQARLPDFASGVSYWSNTEASVTGVLGGYGPTTPVPRLDAAASRMLILSILPQLSTVKAPHRDSDNRPRRSFRCLDAGAGVGRVTSTVLLPLFDRVDLVEPVTKFIREAKKQAEKANKEGWKLLANGNKGVRMWQGGLQFFDPAAPAVPVRAQRDETTTASIELVATIGSDQLNWPDPEQRIDAGEEGLDLCMIQWCIGHLSDEELVNLLKRSKKALRSGPDGCEGFIILKENVCKDDEGEGAGFLFDEEDSSITRSDRVFRQVFADAELQLIRREVQQGFPKAYVLR